MIRTALGLALGLALYGDIKGSSEWTPALWFLASEQGGWWEADVPHEIYARVNLTSWSEGTLAQRTSAAETNVSDAGTSIAGYAASIYFADNALQRDLFPISTTYPAGTALTLSAIIQMDDNSAPVPGIGEAGKDFYAFINGGPAISPTVTALGGGLYRVTFQNGTSAGGVSGIRKPTNGTSKGFRVTATQLELGSAFTAYQKVTDWNTEYIAGAAAAGKHITNFVDSAGTIPVTSVEQPVGLALDKRLGLVLGSEIVTVAADRDFSSDTGYWNKASGVSISAGKVNFAGVLNDNGLERAAILTAGKRYEISFEIVSFTSGTGFRFYAGGNYSETKNTVGVHTVRVNCGTANTTGILISSGTVTGSIDNISIKEVLGNHLIQPTTASKPKLYARKNLLTYSEDLSNAYWTKTNLTVAAVAGAGPTGGIAHRLTDNSTSGVHVFHRGLVTPVDTTWRTVSIDVKGETARYVCFTVSINNTTDSQVYNFDTQDGVWTNSPGTTFMEPAAAPLSIGNGWWRLSLKCNYASANLGDFRFGIGSTGLTAGNTYVGSGSTVLVANLQAELGQARTTYQRIAAATDYDTVGFPHTWKFDAFDDFLYTAGNVDFTATDKMTVVAGVTSLANSYANIVELGTDVSAGNGFALQRGFAGSDYFSAIYGSALGYRYTGNFAAPDSSILAMVYDIAGASIGFEVDGRRNGAAISWASGTGSAGTGNFTSKVLYVGRRAGTSLPFNGELSSLVVRGAQTADVTPGEEYAADKHGVTL